MKATARDRYHANPSPLKAVARRRYHAKPSPKKAAAVKAYKAKPLLKIAASKLYYSKKRLQMLSSFNAYYKKKGRIVCIMRRSRYALNEPKMNVKHMCIKQFQRKFFVAQMFEWNYVNASHVRMWRLQRA